MMLEKKAQTQKGVLCYTILCCEMSVSSVILPDATLASQFEHSPSPDIQKELHQAIHLGHR
jgi:hypothetical protein